MTDTASLSAAIVSLLEVRRETVATAESLTGGLVCAALVDAPGASAVVNGGVIAYDARIKAELLSVNESMIASNGTVDAGVAHEMAEGVRDRLGATWGLSTTGVAGPDPAEGKPVGTVFIAVAGPEADAARALALSGDRRSIRDSTVVEVLSLLLATLEEQSGSADS